MSRSLVALLVYLLLAGCAHSQVRVLSAVEMEDCRKVWVWSHAHNHSEIIFRAKDVYDGFWAVIGVAEPGEAVGFVSFGIFDVEWSLGERSMLAAMLSSPGGVAIKHYFDSPEVRIFNPELVPVVVTPSELQRMLEFISRDVYRNQQGEAMAVTTKRGLLEAGYAVDVHTVQSVKPYSAANFCHSWVTDTLEYGLALQIAGPIYTQEAMLEVLGNTFPRRVQVCPGYLNNSSKKPGESQVIGPRQY